METNHAERAQAYLATVIKRKQAPGIQYLALDSTDTLCRYDGGLAEINRNVAMDSATTMMAYSMSKTITAAAVLQLVEAQRIQLDDPMTRYVGSTSYGAEVTIRHLLSHTSGIPNPIPLRWVHSEARHVIFDEHKALSALMRRHCRLSFRPGTRFRYSNLGYWLLGEIVERVTGEKFASYVAEHLLQPLGILQGELSYTIPDPHHHAGGYLEKYSLLNLAKRLFIDGEYIGGYEGPWLRIRSHYVNGPAFGV